MKAILPLPGTGTNDRSNDSRLGRAIDMFLKGMPLVCLVALCPGCNQSTPPTFKMVTGGESPYVVSSGNSITFQVQPVGQVTSGWTVTWSMSGATEGCRLEADGACATLYDDDNLDTVGTLTIQGMVHPSSGSGSDLALTQSVDREPCYYTETTCLDCQFGSGTPENLLGGVFFPLALGADTDQQSAGLILLQSGTTVSTMSPASATLYATRAASAGPPAPLYSPAALTVPYSNRPNVVVSNGTNGLLSVATPQGSVVVQADAQNPELGYSLQVYATNSLSPFVTWVVENPDKSGQSTNQLRITENRTSGPTRSFLYTYDSGSNSWTLTDGGNTRTVVSSQSLDGSSYVRTVLNGTNVVRQVRKFYQWVGSARKLYQLIEGDDQASQTTQYTYYNDNPTNGYNTNQLYQVILPDGRWEVYTYDPAHRVVTNFSVWQNAAPPSAFAPPARAPTS
jgi:hypothetical protein